MKPWLILMILWSAGALCTAAPPRPMTPANKMQLAQQIMHYYPELKGNPEKRKRKTFSQFGYGLSEFVVPTFPITKFIDRDRYGLQSYGQPNRSVEHNGMLYTCRGGFIDFSHMRHGIDLTVYLCFRILDNGHDLQMPHDGASLQVSFRALDQLAREDIAALAQKIAFERLIWHEVASWHYHRPVKLFSEQQSTFTPEDNYSNFLGTEIGKRIALRIMDEPASGLSYGQIAAEEIRMMMGQLQAVNSKRDSKIAYDLVDYCKQMKLPEAMQNRDVWYDSRIVFRDQRYMFKRNLETGPELHPWLVPMAEKAGCPASVAAEVLTVPQYTRSGASLYRYYTFTIEPDERLFYSKRGKLLHPPIGRFQTQQFTTVIAHIHRQMEAVLLPGFDRRDNCNPTLYYTDAKRVLFR